MVLKYNICNSSKVHICLENCAQNAGNQKWWITCGALFVTWLRWLSVHACDLRHSQKFSCILEHQQFCSTCDSRSLSLRCLRLSAVRNVWLFVMTIYVLFVTTALHQHLPKPLTLPLWCCCCIWRSLSSFFQGFPVSRYRRCRQWLPALGLRSVSWGRRGGGTTTNFLEKLVVWFSSRLDPSGCSGNKNAFLRLSGRFVTFSASPVLGL